MIGALSVFGRRIKGLIRLRPEQVWTCNVTRHYQLTLRKCNEQDYLSVIADNHQYRQIVKPTAQFAVTLLRMGDKYPKHVECI
jgi:hypothetical protein